jgi:hypothetical protein
MSAIIQASPLEKLSQRLLPPGDSCFLIIFGALGDLTKPKLIPGLYNLACEGCMNPEFEVLAIGRTLRSSEEFRKKCGEAAPSRKTHAALASLDGENRLKPEPFVLRVYASVRSRTHHRRLGRGEAEPPGPGMDTNRSGKTLRATWNRHMR